MKPRRGATDLSGILLVDKPAGPTSHDIVACVRRLTGEKRVGHAGTLDPMATGLLVVLVGSATRLTPYLTAASKTYEARITFGSATDTDDAMGETIRTCEVPPALNDPTLAEETVAGLVGTHAQVPPAFCALKRDGVIAHRAARAGTPLDIEPRQIVVERARLVTVEGPDTSWVVELDVSKGTYIRAIARDLGDSLACAAHLSGLRRTRSGHLEVGRAHTLDALEAMATNPGEGALDIAAHFADPVAALGLDQVIVDDAAAAAVSSGRTIPASSTIGASPSGDAAHAPASAASQKRFPAQDSPQGTTDRSLMCIVHGGRLLAIASLMPSGLKPQIVLAGGVGGCDRA